MINIQTIAGSIDVAVKAVTIILLLIASYRAILKKNNPALIFAVLGNVVVFYFTKSPLLCWVVSIATIIWAGITKTNEQKSSEENKVYKQPLKSSKATIEYKENNKKMVKPGPIIGLIIGILMAGFPIVGFMMGEGSLSDPQGKMIGIGFIIFGAFMIIVNILVLVTGKENLLAPDSSTQTTTVLSKTSREISKEETERKVRCRFCGKRYGADYNGCPYCKKK